MRFCMCSRLLGDERHNRRSPRRYVGSSPRRPYLFSSSNSSLRENFLSRKSIYLAIAVAPVCRQRPVEFAST